MWSWSYHALRVNHTIGVRKPLVNSPTKRKLRPYALLVSTIGNSDRRWASRRWGWSKSRETSHPQLTASHLSETVCMMSLIAITGAAGFVGRALVTRLLESGHEVRANVRSAPAVPGVTTIVGDLNRRNVCARLLEDVDTVVHCAAFTGDDAPARAERDNVNATRSLCESLSPRQRLIFLSSVAVYGKSAHRQTNESAPMAPGASVYAQSKVRAEALVRASHAATATLRPGLIWGGKDRRLVGPIVALLKRRVCFLPGECHTAMPLTHLDNLLDGIELAVATTASGAFNITDDAHVSFTEFCERLASEHGLPSPRHVLTTKRVQSAVSLAHRLPTPIRKYLRPDIVQLLNTECTFDNSRAREVLGYAPTGREHLRAAV